MTIAGSRGTTAQKPATPPARHGVTPPPVARTRWWRRSSLVARFTVVCLVLILGVGLLAAQVVAQQLKSTALDQEADAVKDTVNSRIKNELRPEDLQAPLTPKRIAEIDKLVQDRVRDNNSVGASLWRGDAVVNYATDRSSVGKPATTDEHLAIALAGSLSKEIKPSSEVDFKLDREVAGDVMEIYVPLEYGGKVLGSFEVYRDLVDVDKRIEAVQRAMFVALFGGLAVLFVALLFLIRGASRQLQRQSHELALFAARQEVNRLQTEFVGVVSHELRTPLTALLGFSELLLTDDVPESDRREWTTLLHKGAQRLRHLVEQLLDVSRIDHARLELRVGPVSVAEATEQALHSIAALPNGLEITQRFEPDLPPVLADHEKLVQILTNLVSNAVKYSPDGGLITVDARRVGASVQIAVTDQGLGLPPDELDIIFDRFHRVDDERRRTIEGTGLGLYITRQLVEMHGGAVSVHSLGKGHGSTFTVVLPTTEEEPENA